MWLEQQPSNQLHFFVAYIETRQKLKQTHRFQSKRLTVVWCIACCHDIQFLLSNERILFGKKHTQNEVKQRRCKTSNKGCDFFIHYDNVDMFNAIYAKIHLKTKLWQIQRKLIGLGIRPYLRLVIIV